MSSLQISWNTFSAGMNDQKYQAQAGRYYEGFNVDTRRFDVLPGNTNTLEFDYPARLLSVYNTKIVGGVSNIVWTNDGEIYQDETLRHTFVEGMRGNAIGTLKVAGVQYLYYFSDSIPSATGDKFIHRSGILGKGMTEEFAIYVSDEGYDTLSPPAGMRVISEADRIIFTHYNKLFQIDTAGIVTELLSFASSENIVGITQFLGEYKIYTSIGTVTSKLYTWDGSSSEYTLSVPLTGLYISSVANRGAYDFIIADNDLYKVSGVQYVKLFNRNCGRILGVVENDVYLNYAVDGQEVIGVYGLEPGYTESLTPKYIIDIDDLGADNDLYDLAYDGRDVFIAYGSTLYNLGGGGVTPTNLESYISSLVFVGESIEYVKTISEARIKFSGATDLCKIRLSFQLNESNSWITIWEGTNADIEGVNHGLKIGKNTFNNAVGNFNTIRMKVSFIRSGADRASFYGVDLIGTQNLGK